MEGPEGWILLSEIYDFPKIRRFHDYLSIDELFEILKLSSVVEVMDDIVDWGYEEEVTFYIRKKELKMK